MLDHKEEVSVMYNAGKKGSATAETQPFQPNVSKAAAKHTQSTQQHAMPPKYHVGQRVSFRWELCTVRWIGKLKGRGEKVWIGVEWDVPTRGKNNGSLAGHQYFNCRSSDADTY